MYKLSLFPTVFEQAAKLSRPKTQIKPIIHKIRKSTLSICNRISFLYKLTNYARYSYYNTASRYNNHSNYKNKVYCTVPSSTLWKDSSSLLTARRLSILDLKLFITRQYSYMHAAQHIDIAQCQLKIQGNISSAEDVIHYKISDSQISLIFQKFHWFQVHQSLLIRSNHWLTFLSGIT